MRLFARVLACATTLILSGTAHAQDGANVFKGKTVSVYIGFSAGGTYDYFGRLVARHIGKHIPGNPTVVAQNMVGAGGLTEANWIYNLGPKDGTHIGMIQNALPIMQAVGIPGPQFDPVKFNWVGSIMSTVETLALWHTSGVKTIEDLAGCATDDLVGWTERKDGESIKNAGILDGFDLSREDAEGLIMQARVRAGWIKEEDLAPPPVPAEAEPAATGASA